MELNESQQGRRRRARERMAARQARQMAVFPRTRDQEAGSQPPKGLRWARQRRPEVRHNSKSLRDRVTVWLQDAWWYALHRPYVARGILMALAALFALYIVSHLLGGQLFPNVWSMGINLGDLTVDEAASKLQTAWANQISITLVDADRTWTVRPVDLGMSLDARATAESARGVGLAGIPFGYSVEPVVEIDLFTAQDFLLNLTEEANFAARNAGFAWEGEQLVGVPGSDGRVLDVGRTMEALQANLAQVADQRRLELVMSPIPPEVDDPLPYLAEAQAIASKPFTLTGYDPFRDEHLTWTTDRDTFTSWLEVSIDGLGLRRDTFAEFIDAQNRTLNPEPDGIRYLEPSETMDIVETAIRDKADSADLRIRYHQARYEVVSGDTGYRIARKTGIPFYLLTNANPGMNWDQLSVGDVVTVPSRDVTLPEAVVPEKRIIVNLDTQSLVAYENGQEVFRWLISSGTSSYPTYPGVYQILSHEETALGSTFELCNSSGCGQWEMYWFMGIYEVVPGLMNGFHGAVLLPNGAYLGGGNVGTPYTYGCVMSENGNAEQLYHWADNGTIVEIVSREYLPQSDLARQAFPELAALAETDMVG